MIWLNTLFSLALAVSGLNAYISVYVGSLADQLVREDYITSKCISISRWIKGVPRGDLPVYTNISFTKININIIRKYLNPSRDLSITRWCIIPAL